MIIYIIIYICLLLFSIADFSIVSQKKKVLYFIGVAMILFIGCRRESGADSINYINFFKYQTDTIQNWTNVEKGYSEYGFYYLSVLIKSIYNNIDFYFLSISAITIPFLLKSLINYSIYPILGFCVYYSRFLLLRDMNQIRQALAIVIIIYALKYLSDNKVRLFCLFTLIASCFHYSSIIILPFIFIYKYDLSFKQILYILTGSAIAGFTGGILLKALLTSLGNIVLLTYVNTSNLGLTNPLLYFQILLCLLFSYYEPILRPKQELYNIIKNAYLYSIIILLLTSGLGEIGGRLATIFATCEIFIIPALALTIKPNYIGYIISIVLSSFLFYLNYSKLQQVADIWIYFS
ncbi:EpsG family protein [Phocaeicola coprophilus]